MFTGINIESIKLRLKSLVSFNYEKEEHTENTLNLSVENNTEVTGTKIENLQQIGKQIVLNLPEGATSKDKESITKAVLEGVSTDFLEAPTSSESGTDAKLGDTDTESPAVEFLKNRFAEYVKDKDILLDRGGLFYIYKNRVHIPFTEEELVFLTQSALKNDFPAWFWLFNYRERYGNVVPLLQEVFKHKSQKVRQEVVTSLSEFTDTADTIVSLMHTETNPHVIGFSVTTLLTKEDEVRAQKIIANALTRDIIPVLSVVGKKKIKNAQINLGLSERKFLLKVAEEGWATEKTAALEILCASAEKADLTTLETVLKKVSYQDVGNLILSCIKHIGETSEAKYIEKQLLDASWEEAFVARVETLSGVQYKEVFPQLLKWLGNTNAVTNKFWRDSYKVENIINVLEDAIQNLLDKDTYDIFVQYIIDNYEPTEYGNVMSWRYFSLLKQQVNNQKIVDLLRKETRLVEFDKWKEIESEINFSKKVDSSSNDSLLASITFEKSREALFTLRQIYKSISSEEAVLKISPIIESFRANLKERLNSISSGTHSEDVKNTAKEGLEMLLGENSTYFRLFRKKKKTETDEDKDELFENLMSDVDNFSLIEKEYYAHIFKSKTPEINKLLLESIGRPYESIYESIDNSSGDLQVVSKALEALVEDNENQILKLKAIEALLEIGYVDVQKLRLETLMILFDAREKTKSSVGMTRGSDDWFSAEITYLWAINALTKFGIPDDFEYIKEAANREKIIALNYSRYSSFFDYEVFEELLNLSEVLEDIKDKENAMDALKSLDYKWTKKVLEIED